MRELTETLYDKEQTIERIFQLARQFCNDLQRAYSERYGGLIPLSSLSFRDFYDVVKSLPYRRDVSPVEIVARPRIVLSLSKSGQGRDCKKAAVLIGAYCECNGLKWRLATVSTRPDKKIHHIFPQVFIGGEYINADATYQNMKIGERKKVTKVQYFEPGTYSPLR